MKSVSMPIIKSSFNPHASESRDGTTPLFAVSCAFVIMKLQLPLSNPYLKGTRLLFQLQRDSDCRKYFTRIP